MTLVLSVLLVYAAASLLFATGLVRARHRRSGEAVALSSALPFLSVILPARNEESRLRDTLRSLASEDYPRDRFEVIVVDDRSTDRTSEAANDAGTAFAQFRLLRVTGENAVLLGKQNALHQGIVAARGDYIVLADADCRFSKDHLQVYARAFETGASLAFGRTAVAPVRSPAALFEAADLLYLFTVARAVAAWGRPMSCMGNHMGFRKQDYLLLGGYPALGPSPVEDCQLLSAFRRAGKMVRFLDALRPLVTTAAVGSFKGFVLQRIRWSRSLLHFEPGLQAAGLTAGAANILVLPLLALWIFGGSDAALRLVLFKAGADAMLLSAGALYFREIRLLSGFPLFFLWWILTPWIIPAGLLLISGRRWN